MSYRKLFNRLVRDPSNFEIKGAEAPINNERVIAAFCERLNSFTDQLEKFNDDYYQQLNFGTVKSDALWDNAYSTSKINAARELETKENQELGLYRVEAFKMIHEAAALLNCDVSDIVIAHRCNPKEALKTFDLDISHYTFSDQDLMNILTGLHTETTSLGIELSTGNRPIESAISTFLKHNDESMMYLEREPIDAPSAS